MRNLTIKRTKSFVGSLAKMKIYIEDPTFGETVINDTPCRKLGDLKNGEEKTFSVGDEAAKVFVIADNLSKGFCNEFYELPAGGEDVYLTGKNKFDPAAGNAFRFDNNESPEVLENRKKSTRNGMVIMLIAMAVGFVAGLVIFSALFSNRAPQPKTFTEGDITITLTDEFRAAKMQDFYACFDSKYVGVFVMKEDFSLLETFGNYTVGEYADLFVAVNGLRSASVENADGLTRVVYNGRDPDTGDEYRYAAFMYKTSGAFWIVQFAAETEHYEKYTQNITEWAKTVTFSK